MARFGRSIRYPYTGGAVPVGYKLKHNGTLKSKKHLVKTAWKAGAFVPPSAYAASTAPIVAAPVAPVGGRRTRTHRHRENRQMKKMAKNAPVAPVGGFGFGPSPMIAGLGLVGLLGAGIIGYSLWNRRSFRKTIIPGITSAPIATGFKTGITTGVSGWNTGLTTGAPIVHNRKVPLKERVLSKVSGRPVVTNYH